LVACLGGGALAHPHAFIDASVEVVFDAEGRLSAIHQMWAFDNAFGDVLRLQGDANGDARLDESELDAVEGFLATGFAPFDYYTRVVVDGALLALGAPMEAQASVQDYRLHYEFTIPLAEPVTIQSGAGIDIADFDLNFGLVWVSPPLEAVNLPAGCSLARRDREPGEPRLQALLLQPGIHSLEPDPAAGYAVRAVIGCF
jgi:tRNA threonylcarbamoyladenosine biosynthesis protein TsaE